MATLQELIDLTPEQEKAWNRLVKAVKDFRASGGKFYSVLDTATTLQASICLALMRQG